MRIYSHLSRSTFISTLSTFIVIALMTIMALPAQADRRAQLVLAGPPAAVSFPLIHMAESGMLADLAETVKFVSWRDPDQLRVLALNNEADVLAMPTNVAANLYNRGADLELINVSTWGILWLVSRSDKLTTLADLKGEEIAIPFRADMPDLLFGLISEAQGLNPREDFKLRYVATPMDAMQLLIARRIDHALLAEPAVSMALRRTQSFPISIIAPELHRSVDLQAEWGCVLDRSPRIPQAGIVAMGTIRHDPELMMRIQDAYRDSLLWCQANALECGELVAKHIDMLSAEAVSDAIAVSPLEAVPAADARGELEFLFTELMQRNPAVIGGHMPDSGFYGNDTP